MRMLHFMQKTICTAVNKDTDRGVIGQQELSDKGECYLKRSWMKSVLVFNIKLKNHSYVQDMIHGYKNFSTYCHKTPEIWIIQDNSSLLAYNV